MRSATTLPRQKRYTQTIASCDLPYLGNAPAFGVERGYSTRAGLAAKLILESDLLTGTIISPGPIAAPQWGFDKAKLLIRQLTRNCGLPGLLTGLPTYPWPGPGFSIDLTTRNSNDETTSQGASKQTPTSRPHRCRFHPSSDTVAQISGQECQLKPAHSQRVNKLGTGSQHQTQFGTDK